MASIIIPAGSIPTGGSDCVNVTATDDGFLEGDEQFSITITGTNLTEVTVGAASTSTVNITDTDGIKTTRYSYSCKLLVQITTLKVAMSCIKLILSVLK